MYTAGVSLFIKFVQSIFCVQRRRNRRMLYQGEIQPVGKGGGGIPCESLLRTREGKKTQEKTKPDFHPKVCVPVQSKPMSYTEIRDTSL